jgi:hypothetical protein
LLKNYKNKNKKMKKKDKIPDIFPITPPENIYFNNTFNQLDTQKQGKIETNIVLNSIKTYNLSSEIISIILLLIKRRDQNYFYKDEFFQLYKLISQARENILFQNDNNNEIIYEINDNEKNIYIDDFIREKDVCDNYISINKAKLFFGKIEFSEKKIQEAIDLLKPHKKKDFLSLYEFIIIQHILIKSKNLEIPKKLPYKLSLFLQEEKNFETNVGAWGTKNPKEKLMDEKNKKYMELVKNEENNRIKLNQLYNEIIKINAEQKKIQDEKNKLEKEYTALIKQNENNEISINSSLINSDNYNDITDSQDIDRLYNMIKKANEKEKHITLNLDNNYDYNLSNSQKIFSSTSSINNLSKSEILRHNISSSKNLTYGLKNFNFDN